MRLASDLLRDAKVNSHDYLLISAFTHAIRLIGTVTTTESSVDRSKYFQRGAMYCLVWTRRMMCMQIKLPTRSMGYKACLAGLRVLSDISKS